MLQGKENDAAKSLKLVEGNKDGQSNHMRSSQSTRHMAYLKSPVGPMVVEAAGVKSSMLNGGKVPVSIRRAIFMSSTIRPISYVTRLTSEKDLLYQKEN